MVAGGYSGDGNNRVSTTEILDVDTHKFSFGPTLPVVISDFVLVTALPNSEYVGYLVGGRTDDEFPHTFSDIYGIKRDLSKIQKVGNLQRGRWWHVGASIPEKIQRKC